MFGFKIYIYRILKLANNSLFEAVCLEVAMFGFSHILIKTHIKMQISFTFLEISLLCSDWVGQVVQRKPKLQFKSPALCIDIIIIDILSISTIVGILSIIVIIIDILSISTIVDSLLVLIIIINEILYIVVGIYHTG